MSDTLTTIPPRPVVRRVHIAFAAAVVLALICGAGVIALTLAGTAPADPADIAALRMATGALAGIALALGVGALVTGRPRD